MKGDNAGRENEMACGRGGFHRGQRYKRVWATIKKAVN